MSFSTDVREELSHELPQEDHCRMAEFTAMLLFLGRISTESGRESIRLVTENVITAKTALQLIKKLFPLNVNLSIRRQSGSNRTHRYLITVSDSNDVWCILRETAIFEDSTWQGRIMRRKCCRRSFLRGAFLASGSVSDPGKSYHFEIICRRTEEAAFIRRVFDTFSVTAGETARGPRSVVYIKDSSAIVDALNVLGAYQSLMQMENVRIIKEMRNSANRQYNCDSANINKMIRASARQVEDIHLIQESGRFSDLSQTLRDTALARLEYPDVSIQELGTYLDPPIGKSGVNHRLRKISQFADALREEKT